MSAKAAVVMVRKPATYRRQWFDWAGCAINLALGAYFVVKASHLTLLVLPALFHQTLVSFAFLFRRPMAAKMKGLTPRLLAYACSYLVPAFVLLANSRYPGWRELNHDAAVRWTGFALWLAGTLLELWGLWTLRYAFSIEPQARRLHIHGPYRLARHPIYLAYLLEYGAALIIFPSRVFAVVFAAWFAIMVARAHYEETVLRAAFPEYTSFAQRVGMLGPKTFSRFRAAAAKRAPALPAGRTVCQ